MGGKGEIREEKGEENGKMIWEAAGEQKREWEQRKEEKERNITKGESWSGR